jgi:hypothetical protein
MLGVFAEFERAMIRERVLAGLSRARAEGIQLGRRRLEDTDADKVAAIVAARAKGTAKFARWSRNACQPRRCPARPSRRSVPRRSGLDRILNVSCAGNNAGHVSAKKL